MQFSDLFNQKYFNTEYFAKLQNQQQEIENFKQEQGKEITNMIHSLNDFMESYDKIAPQYKQIANEAIVWEIFKRSKR